MMGASLKSQSQGHHSRCSQQGQLRNKTAVGASILGRSSEVSSDINQLIPEPSQDRASAQQMRGSKRVTVDVAMLPPGDYLTPPALQAAKERNQLYARVDKQPVSVVIMGLFRRKMVAALGRDVKEQGYDGIISLTHLLNSKPPRETQLSTLNILRSLLPPGLPKLFSIIFSSNFPAFSSRLNAMITALACQWLMGPCKVNDVEIDGGAMGKGNGVKVERCRYLEEAGCASVCINSCKVPTQQFFATDMGLSLSMTPNYEDFSCQFAFGKTPMAQAEDPAFKQSCYSQCPSRRLKECSSSGQNDPPCNKIQILQ